MLKCLVYMLLYLCSRVAQVLLGRLKSDNATTMATTVQN